MTSRFLYSSMKDYLAKYRTKTREKRISFMNYLTTQRKRIIERERSKLFKRVIFWGVFLTCGFLIYDQIYRKKVQISKMNSKILNFYSSIMVKQPLKQGVSSTTISPKTIDELSNIISLAYRYHYKIIVRMDEVTKREKIIISQKFDNKCIFINLSGLNNVKIDQINNVLYVQSGATCENVNKTLEKHGYAQIFPQQLQKESFYNVIINNLPLINGQFNKSVINLELISASGKNFRSSSDVNRYGQIPSLNPLFIGTGGIFAVPTAANIKINKQEKTLSINENIKIEISNVNEKIISLRKLNTINTELIDVEISNSLNKNTLIDQFFITCKQKYPQLIQKGNYCKDICQNNNIPISTQVDIRQKRIYNIFFSVNNKIFEQFLIKFDKQFPYEYSNGLLKVGINQSQNHQNHQKYVSVINSITNNNGVLVWCDIPQILLRIKPSLDSSEVGAQLMRKIVQVREGLDHRNILYSHSRYEDYFAKGLFRKLTEYFW